MNLDFFNEPLVIGSQIAGVHASVQGGISHNFTLFLRFLSTCTASCGAKLDHVTAARFGTEKGTDFRKVCSSWGRAICC